MSQETDTIKERLDLVGLISEYVPLKQAGQSFKGLCPFHSEKSPSFIVSPGRGTWHCFGCNEGGDAFTFLEKIEGLDFPAVLKMLAERTGVTLSKQTNIVSTNRRQRLFDVMGEAAVFYHHILLKHAGGKKALEYLLKRGVKETTMGMFQVGYAPMQWDSLQKWLTKKGFTQDEMVATGMVGRNQTGRFYDRFRGRIMFPVQDTQGRILAFGGRIVPWHETGNEGKYVNSPETELYEKRRVVYNLNRAKRALGRGGTPSTGGQACLVVEGYMDVVMMVQAGVENVVASSGTAFTPEHIQQLARFTKTLHFAFDADAAGWKATVAATNVALAAGMAVATVKLPEGKDPADIALETPEKVADYFRTTYSLIAVLLDQFARSSELASREDQLAALIPLLKNVSNPITQGKMVQEVADILHVPEAQVHKLLTAAPSQPAIMLTSLPATPEIPVKSFSPEWNLLGLVMIHAQVRQEVWPRLNAGAFVDPSAQMLYNSLQQLSSAHPDFLTMPSDTLIAALPAGVVSFAQAVVARIEELLEGNDMSAMGEGEALLSSLHKRQLLSRLKLLQERLSSATESEREAVLQEFRGVTEELAAILH